MSKKRKKNIKKAIDMVKFLKAQNRETNPVLIEKTFKDKKKYSRKKKHRKEHLEDL